MNISYRWLQELVPGLDLPPGDLADRLAMLGAPVDEVKDLGSGLGDIVIGRVLAAERHPNADRLSLCIVDAGGADPLQVVCGAPNVRAGGTYPFAPVGATLPDGLQIRRAKIRGQESQGMLCSARELGLGRDHEGILELHGHLEPGQSFLHATGLADTRLAVDVTPNRPDLLSHLGVAREVAAATGHRWRLPELAGAPAGAQGNRGAGIAFRGDASASAAADGVAIRIEDTALCPRYVGLVIRGVRVGPSPEWLASRLRAVGLRPISNVVDATNWVLHELGQPVHAFDLARLGTSVVIRPARKGERITTLDGTERELAAGMLVIADEQRPVAVAGVMGGLDTEVQQDTTDVLLECALFNAPSVRATRSALGLSTDASYRFERGVDASLMETAVQRAAALIMNTAGGAAAAEAAVAGPGLEPPPSVRLRLARVEQILGETFDAQSVAVCLEPLGFTVRTGEAVLEVGVPEHRRHDVSREEDLVEEVARRHGYDRFSDELRPFRPGTVPVHPLFLVEDRVRRTLVARGFLEAHTAAFAPEAEGDVALMLPLAATEGRLRRALVPGLLRRLEYNFARNARSIRLFEVGTVFAPAEQDGGLPAEQTRLAVAFTGLRRPPHFSAPAEAFDLWDLKALADELADMFRLTVAEGLAAELSQRGAGALLDAGLSFTLASRENGEARGCAGRVRQGAVDAPAWAGEVWALELRLESGGQGRLRYTPLPVHPAVERDLALLVPAGATAGAVSAGVRHAAGPLLEAVEAFDLYTGPGIPEGQRSIAWALRFRAPDRTLTDAEVDAAVARVLQHLNDELGVRQRA
jgi:phenylalanyl-tRNA synthetase beta chain